MKSQATLGELYGPATTVTTQEEADAYFEKLVSWHASVYPQRPREKVEEIERTNLGYYAGYYDAETRARVERLFRCAHPIFGAIAEKGQPSCEEAFEAGVRMADQFLHDQHIPTKDKHE